MSTLYIRLPSKAAVGNAPGWPALPCPFALVSHDASITRQGATPLPELSGLISTAQRVVLLLAASDVTLLRIKAPPLSHARLRAALPNLVEDQLIADPSDSVVVAGGLSDGLRTVAVVQRAWLDALSRTLVTYGARQIAALPIQLCLSIQPPAQPGSVAVAINKHGNAIDMALRLSEHDRIGVTIGAGQNESQAHEVIQTLCAVVPEASIALYVPQSEMQAFQAEVNNSGSLNKRIGILADNWPHWISGAKGTTLDLIAGLGAGGAPRLDLRTWRWPLSLAAALLVTNVAALNIDWWHMKGEASALRKNMTQIYKSAFPQETVIIDPVAQMLQKITAAKHDAGLAAPDDFVAITATFGGAWASIPTAAGKPPAIAALEYRDRGLLVRLKPYSGSAGMNDSEALTQKIKAALAERDLSLEQVSSEPAAVWKIRSAK